MIALDAPLRLRRARRNDLNPQRGAHPTELRQRHRPRPRCSASSAAAHTHSSSPCRAPAAPHTARSSARSTAAAAQIVSCGAEPPQRCGSVASSTSVITQPARPRVFKPAMETPIQLHQLAEVRLPLPPLPIRRPLSAPTPQPRRQHPAPQRFVVDRRARLRSPDARPPASARSASPRRRCISPGSAPAPAPLVAADVPPIRARAPPADAAAPSRRPPIPPPQPLRLAIAHAHQRRRRPPASALPAFTRAQHLHARQLPSHSSLSAPIRDLHGRELRGHF